MQVTSVDATALSTDRPAAARYAVACRRKAATKRLSVWRMLAAIVVAAPAWNGAAWGQEASWPRSITIATASPGGPYYAYGEGLARILTRALKIETTAQVTQGPAQNIVLMEKKEAMLGFITMGVGLQGWNGTDWTKGTRYRSMRVIFPMYDTAFQFAAPKRLGIKTLNDFSGLRIGIGPRAGTGGSYIPEIFRVLGIAANIRFGAMEQMASQMANGELDAVVIATGVPTPALAELDSAQPLDFIQLAPEQIAKVRKQIPEFTTSMIPAGTYRSLAQNYHTIGLFNFAIAHKDLPDDLVYRIIKAVFDNHAELVKAHSSAKETIQGNIDRNTMLPLHAGAIRYYREVGVAVPPGATVGN